MCVFKLSNLYCLLLEENIIRNKIILENYLFIANNIFLQILKTYLLSELLRLIFPCYKYQVTNILNLFNNV